MEPLVDRVENNSRWSCTALYKCREMPNCLLEYIFGNIFFWTHEIIILFSIKFPAYRIIITCDYIFGFLDFFVALALCILLLSYNCHFYFSISCVIWLLAGLSLMSQELTAMLLAVRLYCSFVMEYDIHTLLDSAKLLATLGVIYMIRFKLRSSYMEDKDNFPIYYVVSFFSSPLSFILWYMVWGRSSLVYQWSSFFFGLSFLCGRSQRLSNTYTTVMVARNLFLFMLGMLVDHFSSFSSLLLVCLTIYICLAISVIWSSFSLSMCQPNIFLHQLPEIGQPLQYEKQT